MPFTPPFPSREPPRNALDVLRRARRNLISVFSEQSFSADTIAYRMLRQHTFICNSPETVRQVFVEDAANVEAKSPQMVHALRPLLGNGLFVSEGAHWAKHRRIVAPLTHISRLAEFLPAMTAAIAQRAARWQARMGTETDILADMAELTADAIGRALFGGRLGATAATEIVRSFSAYQKSVEQMDMLSMLNLPDSFPRWHGRATQRAATQIKTLVGSMIAGLDAAGEAEHGTLVSLMTDAFRAEGVAEADIRDEATVILMAGHETTANTLAWAWFCLSEDEASWHALAEEVRALGRPPSDLDDLKRLPFARAVIDETLRLFPPVPLLTRRSRLPRDVAGHAVPAGALVMIVPWLLHRHRKYWRNPDRFDPWRFMPGGDGVPDRYCYVPFSIGPRICSGMAFALTETVLCLATLAGIARPRLRSGHAVMPIARLSLRPGDHLPMTLTPGALAA